MRGRDVKSVDRKGAGAGIWIQWRERDKRDEEKYMS